jgi:hypothetical protein
LVEIKYQNYLIEEEKGLDHFIPKIQAECKPFLKDIKGAAGTLFRDDVKNRNKPIWKKVTRMNRRPLDTPMDLHNALDDWFLKKFGWRARSQALFCWPLKFISDFTSYKWLVFPAGNYRFLWSDRLDDLWADISGIYNTDMEIFIKDFESIYGNSYHNDKIKQSMRWSGEIMINCKYSYLARAELMGPLNEALGLRWQGAAYRGRQI